ncbi:MAG: TatD family hydrolase [Nanoarchaeota archaeon]
MLVDVHCHLTDEKLENLDLVIKNAKKNDVVSIISNGTNFEDNLNVLKLSKKHDIVKASLGLYPLDAVKLNEEDLDKTFEQIRKNKKDIIAIGEVGMDFKHNQEFNKQKDIFLKIIELSEKIKKPLIIHSRGAEKEVIELLETSRSKRFLMHSFTGNYKLVKKIFDNNYFLSIPCNIVRSTHFQDIIKNFEMKQILTETDSPYLSPYKDKMNEPSFIVETIKKISEIKMLEKEEVEKIIFMNYQNFFLKS